MAHASKPFVDNLMRIIPVLAPTPAIALPRRARLTDAPEPCSVWTPLLAVAAHLVPVHCGQPVCADVTDRAIDGGPAIHRHNTRCCLGTDVCVNSRSLLPCAGWPSVGMTSQFCSRQRR
jgi:hypothetical protein